MKKSSEENRSESRAAANTEVAQNRAISQLMGDEEEVQAKFNGAQLQADEEEVQAKFKTTQLQADEEVQAKFKTAQLQADEEEVQAKQLKADTNKTGMPDNLKTGIETLSGVDVSDVRVHYNSSKPAQMNAHAYAQGTNIHISPGQEQHLPHEAWHTVQQKQGRVQPTTSVNGTPVNDNKSLESEADSMGAKAASFK